MNKHFLLSLLASILMNIILAQCPTGIVIIGSQEDIDAFEENYPDCTTISSDLVIGSIGNSNIDLSALQNIKLVKGEVRISSSTITSLSGLNNLTTIEGSLNISENENLADISALKNVTLIGGSITIANNTKLKQLLGLEGVKEINGILVVQKNNALQHFSSLNNLSSISGGLSIHSNPNLTHFSGLGNLKSVGNFIHIYQNENLTDMSDLKNLNSVGGDLSFYGNNAIMNLTGLEGIINIGGNLEVTNNELLTDIQGLKNLKSVGENLVIMDNKSLVDLLGLTNLSTIGKNLKIESNRAIVSLAGLENLESIGNDLLVINNSKLVDLSNLNKLNTVNGTLDIEKNSRLTKLSWFKNKNSFNGNLVIDNNNDLINLSDLENIVSIGGYLSIRENLMLADITGLKNLSTLGAGLSIYSNSRLTSISSLENLTEINGLLRVSGNGSLTDLEGLQNITSIKSSLEIESNVDLLSLSVFKNLTSINGDLRIARNSLLTTFEGLENINFISGELYIENNNSLVDITALKNLNSINGNLSLLYNRVLSELSGLENLRLIDGNLEIIANDALNSLLSLSNFNSLNGNVKIHDNPLLNSCSLQPICNYLASEGYRKIDDNAQGCNTELEILENCKDLAKIESRIFYDANQNKVQDGNEQLVPIDVVNLEPNNRNILQNPATGLGIQYVIPGNYVISIDEANITNWNFTTDSTSYHLSLKENDCKVVSFGCYPNQFISAMQSAINSSNIRCNDTIPFNLATKNLGTTNTEGVLWFNIDSAVVETQFVNQPDTVILPNQYGWFFSDLAPSRLLNKKVNLVIPGPPNFELGNSLIFESFVEFKDENGEQQSETFTYKTEVRCSYDPNDKLVNPQRFCDYVLFDENITYTIRFQNTGNDLAYKVSITDQIDSNLDLSTFNLIASSHIDSLQTTITDDGLVTFEFNNINLPDSTTNLKGSQGYVSYSIKAKTGLPENTIIKNSSAIYFDYNPAIITNTVENDLVSELPNITWCRDFNKNGLGDPNHSIESCEQPEGYVADCSDPNDLVSIEEESIRDLISIYPNPSKGIFKIDFGGAHFSIAWVSLYNSYGQQILEPKKLSYDRQWLEFSNLSNGVYYLNIELDDMVLRKKLLVLR